MKIVFMSILDTIQFSGLLTSTYAIPPIMTVLLLHINTPCVLMFSKYIFPERVYSSMQIKGNIYVYILFIRRVLLV